MSNTSPKFPAILNRLLRWGVFGLAVTVYLGGNVAHGSIICPEAPEFKFEEPTTTGTTAPAEQPRPVASPHVDNEFVTQHAFAGNAGSTSGTSTTSITSIGSTLSVALRSLNADAPADLGLTGWVAGELRFSLPAPPGNDLLRPPQA